jgi:hypothetical protein
MTEPRSFVRTHFLDDLCVKTRDTPKISCCASCVRRVATVEKYPFAAELVRVAAT